MNVLKDIVVKKQMKPVKFKDGTMKVDMFTASAITQVYNKVNMDNKKIELITNHNISPNAQDLIKGSKKYFVMILNHAKSKYLN